MECGMQRKEDKGVRGPVLPWPARGLAHIVAHTYGPFSGDALPPPASPRTSTDDATPFPHTHQNQPMPSHLHMHAPANLGTPQGLMHAPPPLRTQPPRRPGSRGSGGWRT